jgi:hypothetical protein
MQKQLHELLSREMTRQEFLATIGLGVASVLGFSGLLRVLSGKSHGNHQQQDYGYGRSAYGGNSEG